MQHPYPASAYDDNFCLKPPLMLWVALAYLSRAVTVPLLMVVSSYFANSSVGDTFGLVSHVYDRRAIAPALVALLVLFALVRRTPRASRLTRAIWRHGRALLIVAAILDVALAFVTPLSDPTVDEAWVRAGIGGLIDGWLVFYIAKAARLRDTFAEFPPPIDA